MGRPGIGQPGAGIDAVATVSRDADTLVFRGALARASVAGVWRQAQPLRTGIGRLDLTAVTLVDSAGVALLAALANGGSATGGRIHGDPAGGSNSAGPGIAVIGMPTGLAELRAAYRLDDRLAFAS